MGKRALPLRPRRQEAQETGFSLTLPALVNRLTTPCPVYLKSCWDGHLGGTGPYPNPSLA